ncbi:MAG: DUF429 domain-containing protein [Acetobacteraceae bacterium]|nr:DUF429 domain-containing protein [Acetobacteraceae bacterium]
MTGTAPDLPDPPILLAAHADWSSDAAKRWIAIGVQQAGRGWRLLPPRPVGDVAGLLSRLRAQAAGAPVAVGVDFPIGLPRGFAKGRREAGFMPFLRGLASSPEFFRVCATLAEAGPGRPFYPAHTTAGVTRAAHATALGLDGPAALCRLCDLATAERPAGAPLFWTLGANQSGKAAIAAWRDLLLPALEQREAALRFWPFDGPFRALLEPGVVAIAETYPAEALRHFGLHLRGSKRRQSDRAAIAAPLIAVMAALDCAPHAALRRLAADGFGDDRAGEDRLDCVVGLLCVINVLAGNRPDTAPDLPLVRVWEGWVLGQTALPAGLKP